MGTKVLLVYPRFGVASFWSLTPVTELCRVKRPEPPLGLLTVAALLPADWEVRLIDSNVESFESADLDWADMVMTGGMIAQRRDTVAVIERCRAHGTPVVVGGPDPTSCPEIYEAADFLVLGEAEGILGEFVAAWQGGARAGRFRAEKFTVDVTASPIPRFDLLKLGHYLYFGVQFSRGCPFNCEFCDIIELYGRMPRAKTTAQVLRELDAVHATGHRGPVNFVDDNLIGNKKALKQLLPELAKWQRERDYPFLFMTEASINLADDEELLRLLKQANFFLVFIGIETPDAATLTSIRKKQNTRRDLVASVHRVHAAGLFVIAGFIVGFDTERDSVAREMIDCIEATGIAACAIGLLTALPNTQLYRRLEREGRLLPAITREGDLYSAAINFRTLRPVADILRDYRAVLAAVYTPQAYFERVRQTGRRLNRQVHAPAPPTEPAAPAPPTGLAARLRGTLRSFGVQTYGFGGLMAQNLRILRDFVYIVTVKRRDLFWPFWRTLIDIARHNPMALESSIIQMGLYLHFGAFAQGMVNDLDLRIAQLDSEQERAAA